MTSLSEAAEIFNTKLRDHIRSEVDRISSLPKSKHHSELLTLSIDVESALMEVDSFAQSDVDRLVRKAYNNGGI